jgi:hypothetical protein
LPRLRTSSRITHTSLPTHPRNLALHTTNTLTRLIFLNPHKKTIAQKAPSDLSLSTSITLLAGSKLSFPLTHVIHHLLIERLNPHLRSSDTSYTLDPYYTIPYRNYTPPNRTILPPRTHAPNRPHSIFPPFCIRVCLCLLYYSTPHTYVSSVSPLFRFSATADPPSRIITNRTYYPSFPSSPSDTGVVVRLPPLSELCHFLTLSPPHNNFPGIFPNELDSRWDRGRERERERERVKREWDARRGKKQEQEESGNCRKQREKVGKGKREMLTSGMCHLIF